MCPLNHRLAKPLSISPVLSAVLSLMFLIVLGLGMTAFERTALAQDTGWELTVGGGYSGWLDADPMFNGQGYSPHVDHGFSVMMTGGYRFKDWFSLNLEESFIAGYPNDNYNHRTESGSIVFGKVFLNETSLFVKFIWMNDSKDFEMYCKLGLGIVVGKVYPSRPKYDDDTWIKWNLPIGIGMNYFFTDQLGIGFDAQYDFWAVSGFIRAMAHVAVRF